MRFQEEGKELRLPGLMYADDFCDESEKDLRAILGRFIEVWRIGLKVNAGNSKVMFLGGEKG